MKKKINRFLKVSEQPIYQVLAVSAIVSLVIYNFYPNPYSFPIFLVLVVCLISYIVYYLIKNM